jgi:hypothetical protein
VSVWQPIETAPKAIADPVLVANGQRVVRAFWFVQTPRASGWCIALADNGPVWLRWQPTHWMPLPEPPEVSRGL